MAVWISSIDASIRWKGSSGIGCLVPETRETITPVQSAACDAWRNHSWLARQGRRGRRRMAPPRALLVIIGGAQQQPLGERPAHQLDADRQPVAEEAAGQAEGGEHHHRSE